MRWEEINRGELFEATLLHTGERYLCGRVMGLRYSDRMYDTLVLIKDLSENCTWKWQAENLPLIIPYPVEDEFEGVEYKAWLGCPEWDSIVAAPQFAVNVALQVGMYFGRTGVLYGRCLVNESSDLLWVELGTCVVCMSPSQNLRTEVKRVIPCTFVDEREDWYLV